MLDFIRIHPADNVAVALRPAPAGTAFAGVTAAEDIPQGHKMALAPIAAGGSVVKYGVPIGRAAGDIPAGAWVHVHNVKTALDEAAAYTYAPAAAPLAPRQPDYFQGYLRADGRAAVRNELWIIPTVGCVNDIAQALAAQNRHLASGGVEAVRAFRHPFGCSQMGDDHARTRKLLAALCRHPNAGGVLVLSLGCENLTHEQFLQELGPYDPDRVQFLTCQDVPDELAAGGALLAKLAAHMGKDRRQRLPAAKLVVGMKCGGSDGLSGITANPVVGAFSDLLVAQGGSTVLTEVPELFGAEGLLLGRCQNEAVFRKAAAMLGGFKQYFTGHGQVVYENPSPGNKAGGITTLEDKSCGCVQKGGAAPVADVLGYGEAVSVPGLNLLEGPGNDLVSATALTAAGCHLILFTTGRGTPFGAPAPTVKIATNSRLAAQKPGWVDFNAGTVAEGEDIQSAAARLLRLVLDVAGGRKSKSEAQGFGDISIWKDGVVL